MGRFLGWSQGCYASQMIDWHIQRLFQWNELPVVQKCTCRWNTCNSLWMPKVRRISNAIICFQEHPSIVQNFLPAPPCRSMDVTWWLKTKVRPGIFQSRSSCGPLPSLLVKKNTLHHCKAIHPFGKYRWEKYTYRFWEVSNFCQETD